LKADLNLEIELAKFDKKSGLYHKSWKYNLKPSIPAIATETFKIFNVAALQLKNDQNKKE
jgi:hypothetical protein